MSEPSAARAEPTRAPSARRPVLPIVRPLLVAGWSIAAVRLLLDAYAPSIAWYFGLYFAMPIVLLLVSLDGRFDDLPWPRLAWAMFVTAALVWIPSHLVAYGVAQFAGWTHGRFIPVVQSGGVAPTTGSKLVATVGIALMTALAGALYLTATATVLVWWLRKAFRRDDVAAA